MDCWLIFELTAVAIPIVLFRGSASKKSKQDDDQDWVVDQVNPNSDHSSHAVCCGSLTR
jgi:hypothetical protein